MIKELNYEEKVEKENKQFLKSYEGEGIRSQFLMVAELLGGEKIKLILSNGFHYSGKVTEANEDQITIIDIKNAVVTISRRDIMVLEVLANG